MTKLFDLRKWTSSFRRDYSKYRIVFVVGGSKQVLVQKLARQKNTKVTAIDCEEELIRCKSLHQRLGVQQFSLGNRESLATLCQDAAEAVKDVSRRVAAMLSREGCGASPMAGYLATEKLVRSDEFERYLQSVIADSIKSTNGRIQFYEVLILGSYVGGVGAGASIPIAEKMQATLASLDIPVKLVIDVLGPLTFTGISPVSGMNAAATLGDLVHKATDKSNPEFERMAVHVHLSELPPQGQNKEFRSHLIQLDEEAIRSTELQEHLIQMSPNQAATGPLGNIISREAEFFPALSGEEEVLPTVADNLLSSLKDSLADVLIDTSIIRERRWQPTRKTLNRLSTADIVGRAEELSTEELVTALTRPGDNTEYRLLFDLGGDGEFDLHRLDEYYSMLPNTCSKAVTQLGHLETFGHAVDEEIHFVNNDLNFYSGEVQRLQVVVESLHQSIGKPSWFRSQERVRQDFMQQADSLRQANDQKIDCEARLASLSLSHRRVLTEKEFLTTRLQDVQAMLEQFVPRGRDTFSGRLVITSSLDDVFRELLTLTMRPIIEQKEGLCRFAPVVSLKGLAHIVGSTVTKVEDIANQIVFSDNVLQSPPHGAVARVERVLKAYALPPIEDAFRETLRKEIARLDPETIVVFNDNTDSAIIGVTVIRYQFRAFAHVDQLVVGMNKYDLFRAESSDTGTLRFPTGRNRMPGFSRRGNLPPNGHPPSVNDAADRTASMNPNQTPPTGGGY